jgi:hypothetical protein
MTGPLLEFLAVVISGGAFGVLLSHFFFPRIFG